MIKIDKSNEKFLLWLIMALLSILYQSIGNSLVPELENMGIVVAILFLLAIHFLKMDVNSKGGKE